MIRQLARRHYERARQFEMLDKLELAEEAYRRCVALSPDFVDPYLALARLEVGQAHLDEALELLDAAARVDEDSQIFEWRAYVNGRLRRYEAALDDYARVLEEGDPNVRVNYGRMLLALGRFDEAEEALGPIAEEPAAGLLMEALPRYREFTGGERMDDPRAIRYLFGGTVVLGTLGDGGVRMTGTRYLQLSVAHCAVTLRRLFTLIERRRWSFGAVAGAGPHHGPLAKAVAERLALPHLTSPEGVMIEAPVLLVSGVVKGGAAAESLRAPWKTAGLDPLHFAVGYVPEGESTGDEPHLVGFANRCALPWYRVEPYARLVRDDEAEEAAPWPGFRVGPAFVDPNMGRVTRDLLDALDAARRDPHRTAVLRWYTARHTGARAFRWPTRTSEEGE